MSVDREVGCTSKAGITGKRPEDRDLGAFLFEVIIAEKTAAKGRRRFNGSPFFGVN